MKIFAEINGIQYKPYNTATLEKFSMQAFNINTCPAYCLLLGKEFNFSLSKWISPKRTRSYPFERVYNTLGFTKRVTVIPIIKDEGKKGDRDFIQWDTVSLMSLLDVYVVLCYYVDAEKHKTRENKVTNQKFNDDYIKSKLSEVINYHSSALHWNLKEVKDTLPFLIDKVKTHYSKISSKCNVEFHNYSGIEKFRQQFVSGVEEFMTTSRDKAKKAQRRESLTFQPKEFLATESKATITINNYLGGLYYFTTDEIEVIDNKLFLIESKHSKKAKLPSIGDIKDGLFKMILYCNLEKISVNGIVYDPKPMLKLTSNEIYSQITSDDNNEKINAFIKVNQFNNKQIEIVHSVFREGKENNFTVLISEAN